MCTSGNDLSVTVRERLERIVIRLVAMAARPQLDPDMRNELLELANQLSLLLEE
jgi:hypothetical protein